MSIEQHELRQTQSHASIDKKIETAYIEQDVGGLSAAQRTLVLAAEEEKAKSLGTFTAIRYYWVAFLWSQYCSVGAILVGYDGTVSWIAQLYRGSGI